MGLEFYGRIEAVTKNGAELPKFEVFKFASSKYKSKHMYWDSKQADPDTVKVIFDEVAKSKVLTFAKEADSEVDSVLKQAKRSKDKTGNIIRIYLKFRNNNGGVNTIKKTLEFWQPDVIWRGNEKDSAIGNFSLSVWTIKIPDDDENAGVSVIDQ